MNVTANLLIVFQLVWGVLISTNCAAVSVELELLDDGTSKSIPGLIQIRDSNGVVVPLPSLLSRGYGLEKRSAIHDWWVVKQPVTVELATGRYSIRAFSGLETELTERPFEVRTAASKVSLRIKRFFDAHRSGLRSANTHLHLKQISRDEADRYLVEVPLADGLDLLFLSYLERAVADLEYTSNKYTDEDLVRLSAKGVQFGNGQEHRHNFTASDEGYGHVMLLNIPELIQPVSIGPGITLKGTDGPPLRVGMERAKAIGSTLIWCHNNWGLEDIPSWIAGRLHANNIFDGGSHGSYEHSFYRYLNVGIRAPFSTGTDWFMYDFSRVYVPATTTLSASQWLDVFRKGQTWITNGPLLEFKIAGKSIGETVELAEPSSVAITARVMGRVDFGRVEVVQNGRVIAQTQSQPVGGHFVADFAETIPIKNTCWIAIRTPPPPFDGGPTSQEAVAKNELGCDLFAHSSAIYVQVAGQNQFDPLTGQQLLEEMLTSRKFILSRAKFADDQQRSDVIASYNQAIDELQRRLNNSSR